jgi:hypothetical protein
MNKLAVVVVVVAAAVAGVQGLARLRDADLPVPTNLVFDSFLLK